MWRKRSEFSSMFLGAVLISRHSRNVQIASPTGQTTPSTINFTSGSSEDGDSSNLEDNSAT